MIGSKSSFKREVDGNIGLSQKHEKVQSNLILKGPRKTKPKVRTRTEILSTRADVNEIDTKKLEKVNGAKCWFFKKVYET